MTYFWLLIACGIVRRKVHYQRFSYADGLMVADQSVDSARGKV